MTSGVTRRAVMLGGTGAVGAAALAGCGTGGAAEEDRPLRIKASDTTLFQPNFNPYSGQALQGSSGLIYETLQVATTMDLENPEPWLATESSWNEAGDVLTLSIRTGISWTDGEPFDAEDVAFTFRMLRDVPATNMNALDIADVEVTGPSEVVVTFGSTSFAQEPQILGIPIVPEHIFSTFEDPSAEQVEKPVGTGPYKLDRFSDQLYTFVRNDEHWMAEEFEPKHLAWPSYTSQTMATALQAGDIDWAGDFIANIDEIFVQKDPEHRGHWYPGNGVFNLTFNLEKELWQDLELRKGISLAINREELAEIALLGYVDPPHPTILPRPAFDEFIAEDLLDAAFVYDPEQAEKVLDDAGYTRGPDGVRVAPYGTPLSFSLPIPSDYNDWVIATQVLDEQLKRIGVHFTPQGVSFEKWTEARDMGNFDVTLSIVAAGQGPWFLYRSMLSSKHAPDEDGRVFANFQRWYDDETDALLEAYAQTEDEAERSRAIDGLQRIVMDQLPALPIITAPNWFNYNTTYWTGFPSQDDPYAFGSPIGTADRTIILRRLSRTDKN